VKIRVHNDRNMDKVLYTLITVIHMASCQVIWEYVRSRRYRVEVALSRIDEKTVFDNVHSTSTTPTFSATIFSLIDLSIGCQFVCSWFQKFVE